MKSLIQSVLGIAERAGEAILEVYARDFETSDKEDRSPLTEADLASHAVIVRELAALSPSLPVLSEESKSAPFEDRAGWTRYWLVDPLDGTKEFIKRNGEFTVNIALVENGVPVAGVVHAPVLAKSYVGIAGEGAWTVHGGVWTPIEAKGIEDQVSLVASRSHSNPETEAFVEAVGREHQVELTSIGSSLKLCLVAEGAAHCYPRFGPTMEWDTAAAHAVVRAAGGHVVSPEGEGLVYNKPDLLNPFFIVFGGEPSDWLRYVQR